MAAKHNPLVQRMPGNTVALRPTARVIALRQRDPWEEATAAQRDVAVARLEIVSEVLAMMQQRFSANKAVATLLNRHAAGLLSRRLVYCLRTAAKGDRLAPTRSTILAWCKIVADGGGRVELLEEHKGRVLLEQAAWWGPALEYFNQPTKPEYSVVWRYLAEAEGFAVSYEQVKHYLQGVPAMVGRHSPARIGRNLYRLTEKSYVRRCTERALVGDVYVADGYCADVKLVNPIDGKFPWRPELTVAMDLRSRYIVGWRVDEHEGTVAVQGLWAETLARWNHAPLFLYVDNGSGHKNRLMSNDVTGFYARNNIEVIHAIPGNPHGKGWIERFFVEIKRDFLKLWRPAFYCGHDMAPEAMAETERRVRRGEMQPPTLAEFARDFDDWLARYHARAHPENKEHSKAALWAELVRLPPMANETELKRQQVELTVRRASVKHGKREYKHADLHAYNHKKVVLEYDLMDNAAGVIRTLDGRWICDANLVAAVDAVGNSRLEEKHADRVINQRKRIEKKLDELNARAGLVIDADAVADNAGQLTGPASESNKPSEFSLDDFLTD
ncbi:MAG: transposase [Methylomonas sp.]|nr:MAG: transposase [Methylomonas sp.]